MTKQMIDKMSPDERKAFYDKCGRIRPSDVNLEEYTDAIIAVLYIFHHFNEGNEQYTFERAENLAKIQAGEIKCGYNDGDTVGSIIMDVEWSGL